MSDHFDADEFTCHPADEGRQLTAPLPPLPELGRPFYGPDMQSYAKLAVREALDRAAKKFDQYPGVYANAGGVLRAMLEDYK